MGVTGVEAIAVAIPSVALALNNYNTSRSAGEIKKRRIRTVLVAKEILLVLRGDIVLHSLDEGHLDEATIVVVPPP